MRIDMKVNMEDGSTERIRADEVYVSGGTSHIYLSRLANGTPVALKTMKRSPIPFFRGAAKYFPPHDYDIISRPSHINQEIKCMRQFDGDYFVKLLGTCHRFTQVGLLMEYCPLSLKHLFSGGSAKIGNQWNMWYEDNCLSPGLALHVMVPICAAVKQMHSMGYLHKDIKDDNILISVDGVPKLTDFGLSVKQGSAQHAESDAKVYGSPYFTDPGLYRKKPSDEMSDMFSLGITLLYLASGLTAYSELWANTKWELVRYDIQKLNKGDRYAEVLAMRYRYIGTPKDPRMKGRKGTDAMWVRLRPWLPKLVAYHNPQRISAAKLLEDADLKMINGEWEKWLKHQDSSATFLAYQSIICKALGELASAELKRKTEEKDNFAVIEFEQITV